ncbi:MAG TPA: NAD(P)H-dependent oxidoreductase subunit E [Hyphomicrobiaceae bacterium]|jgi:formate dehydrogenase
MKDSATGYNGRGQSNGRPGGRAIHPGSGRRKAPLYPKGRVLKPEEAAVVRALLGDRPRERALLIEYLHLVQDAQGCLPEGCLHALAAELNIPMAEVYEVATFYAHFDVVGDNEERPPKVTIRVCDSLSCMLAGAERLLAELEAERLPEVRVVRAPCVGACDVAPAAEVGHRHVGHANPAALKSLALGGHVHPEMPAYQDFSAYAKAGGYAVLKACTSGARKVEDVIATLSDGGLRGLGGAGFPTGRKWGLVRAENGPRLMAVNGDEGEPGTFKDRFYLEREPHKFLEGALIAAWAVEAQEVFIYMRDEYPAVHRILANEVPKLEAAGLSKHTKLTVRRGAGAYICGEESAMIESIEGKRGLPRHRPPYVAQVGVFGRPTLVNNIETLYWVPTILEKGAAWFASQGKNGAKGLRSYSVSGRVKKPGVVLTAAGSTCRELIELCGGMADGHHFKGYLPGGASGGILPAYMADIPLDFGQLEKHGAFVGSHAVVILSDKDDMKAVALNLMRFFEDESCGQCTPCRNGTEKAVQLMSAGNWDPDLLDDLSQVMADASICGLGQAAPNPVRSVFKYFPEDLR